MQNLDFIYKRYSVREFKEKDIPIEDLKEIIKAATYAPSGLNVQNWHFVIIKNKKIIEELVKIVEKKHKEILEYAKDENKKERFARYLKFQTSFRGAPVVILVYAGQYNLMEYDLLKEMNSRDSIEIIERIEYASPGIQSVAAAIENLLLAAANLGYGGCWITSCNFANLEIEKLIKLNKDKYSLIATIALGVPGNDIIARPSRKQLEEVFTLIE